MTAHAAKPGSAGDSCQRFVAEYFDGVRPSQVTCLTGAGISANPPTNLPLGVRLTQRVFADFFDPDALDVVLAYHEALRLQTRSPCDSLPSTRFPRLETVLGVAVRIYGSERALHVLDDMRVAQPNPLHAFFATHLLERGLHVTANFDTCIEANLPPDADTAANLWHFHGSLATDHSRSSLGATLAAIESGFDSEAEAKLHWFLTTRDIVVVLGYSGSDFFDIDPAVAKLRRSAMQHKRVLWVAHDAAASAPRRVQEGDPPLASLLTAAGAEVTVLCAPTATVCSQLESMWPSHDLHRTSPRPVQGETPSAVIPELRAAATLELFRELRLHREVAVRMNSHGSHMSPADRWRTRATLLWEQGRFNPDVSPDVLVSGCGYEGKPS